MSRQAKLSRLIKTNMTLLPPDRFCNWRKINKSENLSVGDMYLKF